jgi:uncharacterized Zn finger protein (UPF0148 family)
MAQSFTCPSCGAPLNYNGDGSSTISCPYCYTSVIVPPELRTQQAQPVAADVSSALSGQAHKLRELSNLIRTKQGAQAIALYQQVYGVDSATAQQLVSQLLAGSSMVLTGGHSIKFNTTDGSLNIDTSAGWPNSGSGGYSNNPPSYIPTSPSNYTVSPQPTVYTTKASSGGGANRWGWVIGCVVVLGVLIGLGGAIVPFAIGGLSFLSAGSSIVDTPVSIKLPNINATTTAAFALATKAASQPTKVSASATPSSTPEPTEDINGTATAQALSVDNEQASAQAKLPVFFSDNFTAQRSTWQTGPDNNDYFTGTRAIANGTYIWTFNAKRDVASFVYPLNIKPTKDFYTSVDVKITGPADSDAGLVFRHKSDDTGWYYFAIGGDGRYSLSYYGDSGWETLISLTDSSAVKPGVNTLAVAAQDIHLVLLINDQVVGGLDDDRITSGDVGLAAEIANAGDSGIFTFDNFQILANK